MPVWPAEKEDTVLYEDREIISAKDLVLRCIDDSTLSIWGDLYINGESYQRPTTVDVRRYGAKGDGTTDNQLAIQTAIDECSASGGGVVYIPGGDFAYSGTIHVYDPKVSVQGAGRLVTILRPKTAASLLLFSDTTNPITETSVTRWGFIRDFTVEGALANVGIRLGCISDAGVYDVMIRDTIQAAWQLWGTQNSNFNNTGCVQFDGIGVDIDYTAAGNEWFGHYSNQAGLYHVRFGNGVHLGVFSGATGPSNNEFYGSFFERADPTILAHVWHQGDGWGNRFYGCRIVAGATTTLSPYYMVRVDAADCKFLDFHQCRFLGDNSTRLLNQTAGGIVSFKGCTSWKLSTTDPWVSSTIYPEIRAWKSNDVISANAGLIDLDKQVFGLTGIYLDGTTGNGISTPDHASLDITGDFTLMVWVKLPDYSNVTPQVLLSKWNLGAGGKSYHLRLSTSGQISINWSNDGSTTLSALAAGGLVDGAGYWVAATMDVDDGTGKYAVRFWKSSVLPHQIPVDSEWTQAGSTNSPGGTTSVFVGTQDLWIGSAAAGTSEMMTGLVSRAIVCNDIGVGGLPGSTIVAEWRGDAPMVGRYRDRTGKIWTQNGSNWAWSNIV